MDFSIWFLLGAILVFFMQGGFAMVETGLTRAKNAGNIIMKNLMDFCIGTVVFVLLGYGLLAGDHVFFGLIGKPDLRVFTDFLGWAETDGSNFFFMLVFAATAATIVSGAMAERTKFVSYCIYSGVISLFVYPIEAGWVWGSGGWLANLGYVDFAGSSVIHMVGGLTSLIGAAILGPRIGKYIKDKKTGKTTARAIPGHSITLAALGAFILWFCWYGFNGAAAGNIEQLGAILVNTTIAPAVATVATMLFTWIKNGKPDVSMCLNGSLAGLVAITAGCANVDALGALIIGLVAGILVVVAVEVIDIKVKVDDPVGAIAVHGANGLWGTIAVGLLANPNVPGQDAGTTSGVAGLFYGGGGHQIGIQAIGVLAILAWTAVVMTIVFLIIKKTVGLRVKPEEEIAGLDGPEHGLSSAYGGFVFAPEELLPEGITVPLINAVPIDSAIPVTNTARPGAKLTKVTIITNQSKFAVLQSALDTLGITGMTVTNVLGYGMQKGHTEVYRGVPVETKLLPKIQLDIVISAIPTDTFVETVKKALYTGNVGDGKIFIYDVEDVVKVRTGESGFDALQDDDVN
ncbi:MAG: ammonium transporter [Oscillospiraceae bacterium]|jgi:Amt family ammonium transporter|nr:ammonium transporter [Oscillospiraceae bacterium]